jgi:hypothetical protein
VGVVAVVCSVGIVVCTWSSEVVARGVEVDCSEKDVIKEACVASCEDCGVGGCSIEDCIAVELEGFGERERGNEVEMGISVGSEC